MEILYALFGLDGLDLLALLALGVAFWAAMELVQRAVERNRQ